MLIAQSAFMNPSDVLLPSLPPSLLPPLLPLPPPPFFLSPPPVDSGTEEHRSHTSKTSPKMSPLHPASSGGGGKMFSLFKRKQKARSQSVRDSDVNFQFLEGDKKSGKGVITFPMKNSPMVRKEGGGFTRGCPISDVKV